MAWFKVDDGWWRHRRKVRPLSLAARGLWVTAGSWSADQLTDGHVTRDDLADICPREAPKALDKLAAELVARELWEVTGDGWLFHDWAEYQPTRAAVHERRAADAKRKRDARDARTRRLSIVGGAESGRTEPPASARTP